MKKLITFLFSCVVVFTAQAQTSQGNMSIGGGVSYSSDKRETGGEDVKSSTFTFQPSFGYFVADNLAVGLNLSLSSTKEDNGLGGDDKSSVFFVGPFARYYKFTSNDKFAFFAQAGFNVGSIKDEPDGADETKGSAFNLYISPGFSYFFNEHWALDLQLAGISYTSLDPDKDVDDNKRTNFTFGVDSFDPTIGIRYYFGGK